MYNMYMQVHTHLYDVHILKPLPHKGLYHERQLEQMHILGKLEILLMNGEITEEEYKEKKMTYVETLLDMYVNDLITKEELFERLNQ